ncbi:MAG: hypothetical protein KAJ14_11530 [Candidatus Omnitrophica bacterium]|nr:hypothetical protein [Candidatus Omnitrophota bacterium]
MKFRKYFTTLRRLALTFIFLLLLCLKWPDQTMAVIGFSAIIVALFKDNIYTFYLPPKLELLISSNAECFHEVDATNIQTGQVMEKQFWLGAITKTTGSDLEC